MWWTLLRSGVEFRNSGIKHWRRLRGWVGGQGVPQMHAKDASQSQIQPGPNHTRAKTIAETSSDLEDPCPIVLKAYLLFTENQPRLGQKKKKMKKL
jgi:hypothetical protein